MLTTENTVTLRIQQILTEVRRVVVGKDEVLLWVLAAMLARGHILLEDIPGVGKTTMAQAFSRVLGLECRRVQFTPDVLPSDVTGYTMPDGKGGMVYCPGAVLCNLFLADELNRAASRTQSALLEAMEERQVTVDGVTHPIPTPFLVIATQNPEGAAGTQLLPDSQIDRFALRLKLGYPSARDEAAMILSRQKQNPMDSLQTVVTAAELELLQNQVEDTYLSDAVVKYIVALIQATRTHPQILRGASPRATLSLTALAKAIARLRGRDYVVPGDVQEVFLKSLSHRILLDPHREEQTTPEEVLEKLLRSVPVPRLR